jgi:hypothetical protein
VRFVPYFNRKGISVKRAISVKTFKLLIKTPSIIALLIALSLCLGCTQEDLKKGDFKTEYQGVLLMGGMGYFGKIEKIGTRYIEMTDVYYVHNQQNPETKEVQSILVKRGKEWHGPDRMYINTAHVLMIEPVTVDSKLEKLIKEIKSKNVDAVKK